MAIYPSIHPPIHPSIHRYHLSSIHQFQLSITSSIYSFIHLFFIILPPSIYLPTHSSTHPSTLSFIYFSIHSYLSVCLASFHLCVSVSTGHLPIKHWIATKLVSLFVTCSRDKHSQSLEFSQGNTAMNWQPIEGCGRGRSIDTWKRTFL